MEKQYYKIMWLPDSEKSIWDMKTEKEAEDSLQNYFMSLLNQHINFDSWLKEYNKYYKLWLDEDDETIYNFKNPLLKEILETIKNVNVTLNEKSDKQLFLWYDIDRTFNENYKWEKCPVTNTDLINLGKDYFYINRLISAEANLVFPDNKK